MFLKIYDCSNSSSRPLHRGGGGPFENDVVRQLKENASSFNCIFVSDPNMADLIFTNDVYPLDIECLELPKVKRMDGIFYRPYDASRNDVYNQAALQSTAVIFISEHAQNSFKALYNYPINSSVVLNTADPKQFPKRVRKVSTHTYIAACTDWSREEKRLNTLMHLANAPYFNGTLRLVGTMPTNVSLSPNIESLGYLSQSDLKLAFYESDAFLNFSYRDPLPKVVCQALSSGLPVLCTSSGGSHESVLNCGMCLPESEPPSFESQAPSYLISENDWSSFLSGLSTYRDRLEQRSFEEEFFTMLAGYFSVFRQVVSTESFFL